MEKAKPTWYISPEDALKEVSGWTIQRAELKPALVTRQDLWNDFVKQDDGWTSKALEASTKLVRTALSGPDFVDLFQSVATEVTSSVLEKTKEKATETMVKMAVTQVQAKKSPQIAGAYLEKTPKASEVRSNASAKFISHIAGTFVKIILKIGLGGVIGLAPGLGLVAGAAVAFVVYLGDLDQANIVARHTTIINNILARYNAIRSDAERQKAEKALFEKARSVMINAKQDWEDENQKKWAYKGITITQTDFDTMNATFARRMEKMSRADKAEFYFNFREEFNFARHSGWPSNVFVEPTFDNAKGYDYGASYTVEERMERYLQLHDLASQKQSPYEEEELADDTSHVSALPPNNAFRASKTYHK